MPLSKETKPITSIKKNTFTIEVRKNFVFLRKSITYLTSLKSMIMFPATSTRELRKNFVIFKEINFLLQKHKQHDNVSCNFYHRGKKEVCFLRKSATYFTSIKT